MSKTTPIYALPYPEESDSADVPRDVQALAQRLEAVLPNVGIPTGAGIDWFSTTAPSGFLLCDGSAVSRTTFAALFAVIGVGYGGGDGINTFNLPDTRGRVLVGVAPGGNAEVATLGANDGTAAAARRVRHAHTNGLSLPNHVHSASTDAMKRIDPTYSGNQQITQSNEHGDLVVGNVTVGNPTSLPGIPGTIGVTGGTADGPSYVVANKAIKT